jgi:hypothetical protein
LSSSKKKERTGDSSVKTASSLAKKIARISEEAI